MRDIKFRFVYQGEYQIHYKWYFLDQLVDNSLKELSDIHHQMRLLAKNQYTGLKDKNDKDIYEGDIIKTEFGIGQVVYEIVCFRIIGDNLDLYLGHSNRNKLEIIGNVYENTKLLEMVI